ncbi:thioredoxin fold domain-containing protein [Beggiatoa leptomitoformis]|uniref:Thiol:disulfide interchange protein n=1 Tax=Beggiatoa leptomitoformis TaxID=288004 RepID=A0A2N9YJ59_9GAMM|nr:thioredoxin fold domain-containing protein [Beggiatoa leptomitoformis]ALG69548.2 thioredoxin fold domain-containing protein [Beggiatoa leptomitoformis]AUI70562.2 thioredoxin fold domain-containing protein [Beggiatoa leptomitoformis]
MRIRFILALLALSANSWATSELATPSTSTTAEPIAIQPMQDPVVTPATPAAPLEQHAEKKTDATIPPVLREALKRLIGAEKLDQVKLAPAPIKNMYEVTVGSEVIYISEDGGHVIVGDIRDTKTGTNLTEQKRNNLRATAINSLDEKDMIIFTPKGKTLFTINVFTDVDCGYCRKLHQEVPKLNELGIKVRYLAFPRAGVGSETYQTMVSVWCADDKNAALTAAKNQQSVKPAQCDNPIAKEYELGQQLGVNGTPALVLSDGELLPGYVPADRLVAYLMQKSVPSLSKASSN